LADGTLRRDAMERRRLVMGPRAAKRVSVCPKNRVGRDGAEITFHTLEKPRDEGRASFPEPE
jgi:hypothetical protein